VNGDNPVYLASQNFVCRRDDDVQVGVIISKRKCDGQAVRDLMNLIVIEQEANPHIAKTSRHPKTRTNSPTGSKHIVQSIEVA
jgi:hypothetical protein